MTLLSRFLAWFPTLILVCTLIAIASFCLHPNPLSAIAIPFSLYGLPVIAYRLHNRRFPLQAGISYLAGSGYSPWWGGHQMQVIFIAVPTLEALLRLIPGAFSLWLRLWGSRIGRDVYWTPGLEIADRGLLEVGDRAVFGHGVGLYAHAIKPKRENLMLYVKPIRIGQGAFVGAGSRLAPGVTIGDGAYVLAATDLHPNQVIGAPEVDGEEMGREGDRPPPTP